MIDNKDIIIKSLCATIERQEKEIAFLTRDNDELRETIQDMKERKRNGQAF